MHYTNYTSANTKYTTLHISTKDSTHRRHLNLAPRTAPRSAAASAWLCALDIVVVVFIITPEEHWFYNQ